MNKEAEKTHLRPRLPIYQGPNGGSELRLIHRKPFWMKVEETNYSSKDEWLNKCRNVQVTNWYLVEDPSIKMAGIREQFGTKTKRCWRIVDDVKSYIASDLVRKRWRCLVKLHLM